MNNQGASAGAAMPLIKTVSAVATDYFQLFVYQDSSSSLNIRNGNSLSYFNMTYLGA